MALQIFFHALPVECVIFVTYNPLLVTGLNDVLFIHQTFIHLEEEENQVCVSNCDYVFNPRHYLKWTDLAVIVV